MERGPIYNVKQGIALISFMRFLYVINLVGVKEAEEIMTHYLKSLSSRKKTLHYMIEKAHMPSRMKYGRD